MYYSRVDRGTCRAGQGSGKNNGEGFAAAGGDNQNVFGPQANVFSLSGEDLLDVHGDFLMFLRVRSGAEDKGFLRLGGMSEPAGQGDRAEDRDGALAAQVEGSGPLHVTNDVDHAGVALGDGDYVVGLDFDVGRWVFAVEDLLHVELGARIAAGGVGARARQGDGAVFRQADDGNGGTRGLTRTASHGKNFVEGFAAADAEAKKASYLERDRARNNAVVLSQETEIPPCVHDVLGGLFFVRTLNLEPGQSTQIQIGRA